MRGRCSYIAAFFCVFVVFAALGGEPAQEPATDPEATSKATAAEVLTNDSIIELHRVNFSDDFILQRIAQSKCTFDVSLSGLRTLKGAGVSEAVILAMIQSSSKKDEGHEGASTLSDREISQRVRTTPEGTIYSFDFPARLTAADANKRSYLNVEHGFDDLNYQLAQGVRLTQFKIFSDAWRRDALGFYFRASLFNPPGDDIAADVTFELLSGDVLLARGSVKNINLDEGKSTEVNSHLSVARRSLEGVAAASIARVTVFVRAGS